MQRRPLLWLLVSLACLGGAIYFWRLGDKWEAEKASKVAPSSRAEPKPGAMLKTQTPPPVKLLTQAAPPNPVSPQTNAPAANSRFRYRLSNTSLTVGQLARKDKALILGNALIDTEKPGPAIPDRLRAAKESGSYLVQSSKPLDDDFRAMLREAGATIVSYVPNNAYLVRVSAAGADMLSSDPRTQTVLPYEPYYKLEPALLKVAVEQTPLPMGGGLNLTLFPDAYQATVAALAQMGAPVLSEDRSPFGPVVTVRPAADSLVALAQLPGVQLIERAHARTFANDLSRPRLGVSANSLGITNYLGLTGTNVLINVNDSGVDITHPDLTNRITGDFPISLTDTNGHGTHVIGTIMGSGVVSDTMLVTPPGSGVGDNFHGMAPSANAFVMALDTVFGPTSDSYLQEQAAGTNAFISNNSWNFADASEYDIQAASYDAAVRDALPLVTGSQPLLYVFSAGNGGGGDDNGQNGNPDSILSPATAKNVITVGAIEQFRNITNDVTVDFVTYPGFQPSTDSSDQVASFSSRGNVGIGIEGDNGRFKPDVVAPGTFMISDRSSTWDTNAYYNPTNFSYNTFANQSVATNALTPFSIFVPETAVGLTISVVPNSSSPNPMPPLPIYLRAADNPNFTTYDFLGTNTVTLPADAPALFVPGTTIFYSVGNSTTQSVSFDLQTLLLTTNDVGTYYLVLSNLNNSLGPYYRYESGTSMAAAGVSGMLACMQEFFEQRLQLTNSPALMKALLINGARTLDLYYLREVGSFNFQGWGLPSLPDSIPSLLTNLNVAGSNAGLPMQFFDQDPTNALATGQSKTRMISLQPTAQSSALRMTLVWTDPPGNPAVGIKLVNDLDLIVTNLDTGDVFYGNDIPIHGDFNESWDTNSAPPNDLVNNVENVYLGPPLGSNYTVTVYAHRVNVNAVTANTNNVVQDYALVISSDASSLTNAFTITDTALTTNVAPVVVTAITNGFPVLSQRVGGNSQYAPTTNGIAGQWSFYVYTNTVAVTNANYTNVAFITFVPSTLGLPRMGTREETDPGNSTRIEADIDLYVSGNPALTNLDPVAIAAADKSLTRTGTEKVLYTNSTPGQVYYIGVKSEDQQGAEFGFLGVASATPFGQLDSNGNVPLTILGSFPVPIPDGSPSQPGQAVILAITTEPVSVRKVVVTDTITHENFGDLIGTLVHGQKSSVLNNHTFFDTNGITETFIYDDSGEGDIPGTRKTDGPGSLLNFTGDSAIQGVWMFSMVDDTLTHTGRVDNLSILVEPQINSPTGFDRTIGGNSFFYDFVDVPPEATNLTVSISGNTLAMDLYLRRGNFPTFTGYDKFSLINAGGGSLSITAFDDPPLNPGRYFIAIYNPNPAPQTVHVVVSLGLQLAAVAPTAFASGGSTPILDDAVTYATNTIAVKKRIVDVEVGLRIDHPRVSDLVLTLISPQGTRVLLSENRGGLSPDGFGSGNVITNLFPEQTSGGPLANTNILNVGQNQGTINITYDFFTAPDRMQIYYDGVQIFDSGLISNAGTFSVNFGPGTSTDVIIVMNAGNNSNKGTLWKYTASVTTALYNYAVFTENTKLNPVPIKFAVPPFGGTTGIVSSAVFSDFETSAPGDYLAGATVDGWKVLANKVTVENTPGLANTGTNFLGLRNGGISQTLATTAGSQYGLQFAYRRSPALDPLHWWPGEGNAVDIIGGNNGTLFGGMTFAAGEVGQAFNFNGTFSYVRVPASPSLNVGVGPGLTLDCWINPANVATAQPLMEWNDGSGIDRGSHFWISQAAPFGGGPGCLYANLKDQVANDFVGSHTFASLGGLVTPGVFQHVALTYDKASGIAKMYFNGVVVAQQNFGSFSPQTSYEFDLGKRIAGSDAGALYTGLMDEVGMYDHALTDAQIADIYAAGHLGRCGTQTPPSVCPASEANVIVDGASVGTITGTSNWVSEPLPFTASQNGTPFEIDFLGNPSGMLLDTFSLSSTVQSGYYLPEESLDELVGENAQGDWRLEILDNRAGATNNGPVVLGWKLDFIFETTIPAAIPLMHGIPQTNSVNTNDIRYFLVDVPAWASFATNILLTASGPVNLLFNQSILPTGTNATDISLLTASIGGSVTLSTNAAPAPVLQPGQRYYLGVQNTGTVPVTFAIEVDFNITTLTNAVPLTNSLAAAGIPRYYQYDVSTNAVTVAFQILQTDGNVDLVARRGAPLPDLNSYDYISNNPGSNTESIIVTTNSTPVVLTPGRWYLGVFNNDIQTVNYVIEALEAGPPNIITLTNGVPFDYSAAPGVDLTNFFRFVITQTNSAALFELYNLAGNVDLTLQRGSIPLSQPFFEGSFQPGTNFEQIVIRTNVLGTNINDQWFLGVPNNEITNVSFTIRAVVSTNGMLIGALPIDVVVSPGFPPSTGPTITWRSVNGETYQVQVSTDLINWTVLATVTGTAESTTYVDTTPSGGITYRFYRIVQVPTP